MKVLWKNFFAIVLCVTVLGGAVAIISGLIPVSRDTHPPCEQLPSVNEVTAAIQENKSSIQEIRQLSDGISVQIGKPCPNDLDRGLILVNYETKDERKTIIDWLKNSEGFGAPVHLQKRN